MALNALAVVAAVVGLGGLIVPFIALTAISLSRDEHSPKALRDDD